MDSDVVPVGSSEQFAAAVRLALTLSAADQRRLADLLARIAATSDSEPSTPSDPSHQATEGPRIDPAAQVGAWLQTIEEQAPWTRLQLIEHAIADASTESERAALTAAEAALLAAHPPVAVRRSVVALASRHPIGVLLGLGGLALAVLAFGRNIARVLF